MKTYKYRLDLFPDEFCDVLWGGEALFKHCVAFCRGKGKYLTAHQLKKKECLRKQCKLLVKIEDRNYWIQREAIKKKKKKRRKTKKMWKKNIVITPLHKILVHFSTIYYLQILL